MDNRAMISGRIMVEFQNPPSITGNANRSECTFLSVARNGMLHSSLIFAI
jgi:hypothetical protein